MTLRNIYVDDRNNDDDGFGVGVGVGNCTFYNMLDGKVFVLIISAVCCGPFWFWFGNRTNATTIKVMPIVNVAVIRVLWQLLS